MRCTNCSREVRPVVALDLDGTLLDYHRHLLNFADRYLYTYHLAEPEKNPMYDGTEPFGEWFCQLYGVDMRTFRDIKLAYRSGGMKRTVQPYDGAQALVHNVRQVAEVYLTTTRPYMRLDNVDPDTRFWLEKHDIEFDGLLYDENKYEVLAKIVDRERVVAVLDDQPDQYDAAAEEFGTAIPLLRKTMWNRGVERPQVVAELYAAQSWILLRCETWLAMSRDQGRQHA